MLKNGILNPHLLSLLARVRHTNKLVIADQCGIDELPMLGRQRERDASIADALDAKSAGAEPDVVTLWRNESSEMALRFIGQAESLVRGRDR